MLDRRLSYIKRWHVHPARQVENLPEHQWYVAYYSWLLARGAESVGLAVDREKLLMIALFHDVPEVIIGDVPASFKRLRPDAAEQLKEWEHDAGKFLFNGLADAARDELLGAIYADDCLEKRLAKVADRLSAWTFAEDELRTGNDHFAVICRTIAADLLAVDDSASVAALGAYPSLIKALSERAQKK